MHINEKKLKIGQLRLFMHGDFMSGLEIVISVDIIPFQYKTQLEKMDLQHKQQISVVSFLRNQACR